MKRNYEMDMCSGPILGKLLTFTIPLIFSGILQLLFNAADVMTKFGIFQTGTGSPSTS